MSGHPKQFVLYKDEKGEYRWRLYAANSKIIADSGEGYKNRADCLHGINLVASVASGAPILDGDTKQWIG